MIRIAGWFLRRPFALLGLFVSLGVLSFGLARMQAMGWRDDTLVRPLVVAAGVGMVWGIVNVAACGSRRNAP